MRRGIGITAAAAAALFFAFHTADAQVAEAEHPVFGHTLMWGSGFITTPHAFVAQGSLFGTGTGIFPDPGGGGEYTVARGAFGIALGRFIEVGGTVHNEALAGFGKVQLVQQSGIFPAIAAGAYNITTADQGRFGIEDPFYADIEDATSIFGVFTYVVGPGGTKFPSWVVISGGWGSGLFEKDNPQLADGDEETAGIFGAVALDFQAADNAMIRVVAEWDGFDPNIAAIAYLDGMEVMVGALSVDAGDAPGFDPTSLDLTQTFAGNYYNQVKPFVSVTMDAGAFAALPWTIFGGGGEEE